MIINCHVSIHRKSTRLFAVDIKVSLLAVETEHFVSSVLQQIIWRESQEKVNSEWQNACFRTYKGNGKNDC